MGAGCMETMTALSGETAQARAAQQWEKLQSRDPFPHTLAKTASFLRNGIYAWFVPNSSSYLSSLTLSLTLSRAKHTPKMCSGCSIFPVLLLKSQPHTALCFWINKSFSQQGYETCFWVCMALSALSSIKAAQFEFWAVIISYLNTANESYKLH